MTKMSGKGWEYYSESQSLMTAYISNYIAVQFHTKENRIYYIVGPFYAGPSLMPATFPPALIRPPAQK